MILETFAFLFHTDGTEKVQKEIKDLQKSTEKVTEDNVKLKQGFQDLVTAIGPLVSAYAGLRAVMNFTAENDQLWQMSQLSGMSAKAISELGFAMGQFGGNTQTASHTIQNLQMQIMQLRRTGSGALLQAGMMYGIGFSSDPNKMLENVAKRMESLSLMQKLDLGRMLGLDQATILMLSKGVKNFRAEMERARRYTFINEKVVEQSHEFRKTLSEVGAIVGGIGIDLMSVIMPYVNDVTTFIRDGLEILKKHKFLILEIAGIIGTIAAAFGIFQLVTNPVAQILAAISAIAILGEEIYGYFNGMDGYLTDMANKSPELKAALDDIGESAKKAWEYVKSGQMYKDVSEEFMRLKKWWEETPLEEKKAQLQVKLSETWENVKAKLLEFSKEINTVWNAFLKDSQLSFLKLANYLKTDFQADFERVFSNLSSNLKGISEVIKSFAVTAIDELTKALTKLENSDFYKFLQDFWRKLSNTLHSIDVSLYSTYNKIAAGVVQAAEGQAIIQHAGQDRLLNTLNAMQMRAANDDKNAAMMEAAQQMINQKWVNTSYNVNAPISVYTPEITESTGQNLANGMTNAIGQYATSIPN